MKKATLNIKKLAIYLVVGILLVVAVLYSFKLIKAYDAMNMSNKAFQEKYYK